MRLLVLPLLLALAACNGAPRATAPDVATAEAPAEAQTAATAPEAAAPPPVPSDKPEVPPLPAVAVDELVGVEDSQVLALLGDPALTEDRAPGMAWIYDGIGCRFGLVLYPDLETNKRTVLSVETENDGPCSALLAQP